MKCTYIYIMILKMQSSENWSVWCGFLHQQSSRIWWCFGVSLLSCPAPGSAWLQQTLPCTWGTRWDMEPWPSTKGTLGKQSPWGGKAWLQKPWMGWEYPSSWWCETWDGCCAALGAAQSRTHWGFVTVTHGHVQVCSGPQGSSRQGFIFVEEADKMCFQHAFSLHCLGTPGLTNHFWTSAAWASAYLHMHPKNAWEALRTDEPFWASWQKVWQQQREGFMYKADDKKTGKSPILVLLSVLEQLYFTSQGKNFTLVWGIVLLQGCFYVSLDWLARSIFLKNGSRTLLSFAPRNVFI